MKNEAIFYVYVYSRLDGRYCYVGKGKGQRWKHRGKWGRNKHFLSIRAQAKALGKELPVRKIAENLTNDEAMALERDLILFIGRESVGGPLVNLTDGGDGVTGYIPTPETCAKLSAAFKGRALSPEWRAAVSEGLKNSPAFAAAVAAKIGRPNGSKGKKKSSGWWSTEEGRAKQRANNPGHTGHHHSEKTKVEIRAARAKQPRQISPETQFKPSRTAWNKGFKGYNPSPATQFKPGYQPTEETRAKLSASVAASWKKRRLDAVSTAARETVMTSPAWAEQNSVRYRPSAIAA